MCLVSGVPLSSVTWSQQTQAGCLLLHTIIPWVVKQVSWNCKIPGVFSKTGDFCPEKTHVTFAAAEVGRAQMQWWITLEDGGVEQPVGAGSR